MPSNLISSKAKSNVLWTAFTNIKHFQIIMLSSDYLSINHLKHFCHLNKKHERHILYQVLKMKPNLYFMLVQPWYWNRKTETKPDQCFFMVWVIFVYCFKYENAKRSLQISTVTTLTECLRQNCLNATETAIVEHFKDCNHRIKQLNIT